MSKNIIIGCMILGLLVFTQSVEARYDYELAYGYSGRDSGYREAVDMDDWLERGRAAVTESPVFSNGIRLTAWGGEEVYEPGLASAIYYFTVPRWSQYLKITIRYHDAAQDDSIAGRLWIKSADRDRYGALDADEEAPLYGDTFVLRSERTSETIIVPRSRHVEGNRVEMHIVAEGRDCLDVRDVRIAFLETRPGSITIVHRTYNDYWDWWPRHRYVYHYYYWGPFFWPKTYVVYECWDVPHRFYWRTWRPWFRINIIRVHHHYPWWGPRRYTVVYHCDVKHPPIKRRHLLRKRLRERHVHVTRIIHSKTVIHKTVRKPMRTHPPQKQEIRLKKEVKTPRTFETKVNQNPTQRHLKQQPIRADKGREKLIVNTQTKTMKRPQVVNKPNPRSARPSYTAPQRIKKDQPQPRAVERKFQHRPVVQKPIQAPVQKQLKKQSKEIQKVNTKVKPAPICRHNQAQLVQEKKQPERLAVNKQTRVQKRFEPHVLHKPNSHSVRPPNTASKQIRKDQTQPRTAEQTSRPKSVAREGVRAPTRVHTAQDHGTKQQQTVQRRSKIGHGTMPQSHREIRQPRPHAGTRRLR